MKKACATINHEIGPMLKDRDLSNLKKIDDMLLKFMMDKEATLEEGSTEVVVRRYLFLLTRTQVGPNIIRACSEAISYGVAACYDRTNLYEQFYRRLRGGGIQASENVTSAVFTLLNGGRAVNSKVKFATFYLIAEPASHEDFVEVFRKFQVAFKKAISSSKYGVNIHNMRQGLPPL